MLRSTGSLLVAGGMATALGEVFAVPDVVSGVLCDVSSGRVAFLDIAGTTGFGRVVASRHKAQPAVPAIAVPSNAAKAKCRPLLRRGAAPPGSLEDFVAAGNVGEAGSAVALATGPVAGALPLGATPLEVTPTAASPAPLLAVEKVGT
jgi:hypothetical protein